MKRNVKLLYYMNLKKIRWEDEDIESDQNNVLDLWPDLDKCTKLYYRLCPAMKQHRQIAMQPNSFEYTTQFIRSIDKQCTTKNLRLLLIDALKYHISGVCSTGEQEIKLRS